ARHLLCRDRRSLDRRPLRSVGTTGAGSVPTDGNSLRPFLELTSCFGAHLSKPVIPNPPPIPKESSRGEGSAFGSLLSTPPQMSTERLAIEDSGQQAGFRDRKKKTPRTSRGVLFYKH